MCLNESHFSDKAKVLSMSAKGPGRVKTREVLTVCLIYAWQYDYWRIRLLVTV
jgi:hypothetical protein